MDGQQNGGCALPSISLLSFLYAPGPGDRRLDAAAVWWDRAAGDTRGAGTAVLPVEKADG